MENIDIRWPAQKKLLKKLELFNEKAAEIREDIFEKKGFVKKHEMIKLPVRGGTEDIQVFLLNEERLKSIILSFRFFLQDTDCSFKIMKHVYNALDIHTDYKRMYSHIKDYLDRFLSECDDLYALIDLECVRHTNFEILEVFFYGKYAHEKRKHKKIFDLWYKDPRILGMHQTIFVKNLHMLAGIIQIIRQMNYAVIETFESKIFRIKDFKNVIKDLGLDRLFTQDNVNDH